MTLEVNGREGNVNNQSLFYQTTVVCAFPLLLGRKREPSGNGAAFT